MALKDRPDFRRILELDDILRQGTKVTATTLAQRWETSTKTVQRLIDNFRDEFRAPLEWDARRGTYLYSEPGWHLPWLATEGTDLFAVGVAMKVLQLYEGTPAAKDPGDEVVKTFSLSRMKAARVGTRRFSPPKWFRPEEHFGETIGLHVGKPRFRFRVRFGKEIAEWITEVRWHEKQKLVRLPDGGIELELPAGSLLEARRFVLSFGKHAEVLAPEELVADVKDHVLSLAGVYGGTAG